MTIKTIPIDWRNENGKLVPADSALYAEAIAFCRGEFGSPPELRDYLKVWVTALCDGETLMKVTGIIALQNRLDVPMFHVAKPMEESASGVKDFIRTNDALIDRARNYIIDNGGRGTTIFVHVASDAENLEAVKRNMERIKARPSNRVLMDIG